MSVTRTTHVAVLVLTLTFTAGFIGGAAAHHLFIGHRETLPPLPAVLHRLDRRLDLTDAQRQQVEEILTRRRTRINAMWGGMRPRVRAEVEAMNAEIANILTPEQREKFEKMRMHLSRHRDKANHHGSAHDRHR